MLSLINVITELDTSSILGIPCCSDTLCDAALEMACSKEQGRRVSLCWLS